MTDTFCIDPPIDVDGNLILQRVGHLVQPNELGTQTPCKLCNGSGMVVNSDRSVSKCPKSPGPGHY